MAMKLSKSQVDVSKAELQKQAAEAHRDSLLSVLRQGKEELNQREKELDANLEAIWGHTLDFIEESNKFHTENGLFSVWWKNQTNCLQNDSEYGPMDEEHGQRLNEIEELQREIADLKSTSSVYANQETHLIEELKSSEETIAELKKEQQILRQEPFTAEFINMKEKIQRSKNMCSQLETLAPFSTNSIGDMTSDSAAVKDDVDDQDSLQDYRNKQKDAETFEQSYTTIPPPSANMKAAGSDTKRVRKVFKLREKTTVTVQRQRLQHFGGGCTSLNFAEEANSHFLGENTDISHS